MVAFKKIHSVYYSSYTIWNNIKLASIATDFITLQATHSITIFNLLGSSLPKSY